MVESRVEIYIVYMKVLEIANVGEKIVKTLFSNRVTSENKRIHTLPCPLHSKLGCLMLSIASSNRGTTLNGGDEGRQGRIQDFF